MTEQIMIKKRENWADYAKFIGIFTVIFSHIYTKESDIDIWMYSFHMPLFFILAGWFVSNKKTTAEVFKSSIRNLIIPYICFYMLAFVAETTLAFMQEESVITFEGNVIEVFIGMLLGKGYNTEISRSINMPIWFLVGLFFTRVLFQLALTRKQHSLIFILLLNLISIAIALLLSYYDISLLFSIESSLLAMPFYTLGYLFNRYKLFSTLSGWRSVLLLFLLLTISLFGSLYNVQDGGSVDMRCLKYGDNLFLFYVLGTIGSLAVILLSKCFNEKQWSLLLYFGKNTLIILGVHYWIYHYVYRIWLKYCFAINRELAMTSVDRLVLSVIILFLCFIPIYIINKYFPFMVGKTNPSKIKH